MQNVISTLVFAVTATARQSGRSRNECDEVTRESDKSRASAGLRSDGARRDGAMKQRFPDEAETSESDARQDGGRLTQNWSVFKSTDCHENMIE